MAFLLDEITQQPAALSGVRKFYASAGAIPSKALVKLGGKPSATVVFTGMGSSLYAAYPAQAFLTALGIRAILWETSELIHHHLNALEHDTLLVAVSQSGETVEILRLIERLPADAPLVAISNVERSTLARRAGLLLPMMAGHQTTVSTKTYTCAVAVLMYLAFALADQPTAPLTQALIKAADAEEGILERRMVLMPPTVEFVGLPPYVALLARGADLSTAYQGSLMLKEVPRLAAEPISAAQFRHGPIEIIKPEHRYIVIARHQTPAQKGSEPGRLQAKLADDIRRHGGRVLLISDQPVQDVTNLRLIQAEPIPFGLGTLVDIVIFQLLANDLAVRAGLEPGKFWIATNVTKEE
jgi:glutamine---fructose-6-phosphate transaminase (isomerizing)